VRDQKNRHRGDEASAARPGGSLGIVVWVAAVRLEPFDSYGDVFARPGWMNPSARAWDFDSFKMTRPKLVKPRRLRVTVEAHLTAARLAERRRCGQRHPRYTPYRPVLSALMPGGTIMRCRYCGTGPRRIRSLQHSWQLPRPDRREQRVLKPPCGGRTRRTHTPLRAKHLSAPSAVAP
jgi:hypothetical protein